MSVIKVEKSQYESIKSIEIRHAYIFTIEKR